MFEKKSIRLGLFFGVSASLLALSACSTQNAGSRYGDAGANCQVEMTTCVGIVDRGYWVTPVHHVQTVEKEIIVEKEVVKELPPVTVYEPAPCPADTTPDSNGACIRTVTIEVPTTPETPSCPEGTIPGYGGYDCITIRVHRK